MVYLKSEMDDLSPESKKIVKDWLKKSEAELKNQVEKKQSNGQ